MTHLRKIQAMQKAEVLQMRGCGFSSYNYNDVIYDAGCYDWEVVCTPDGGYTEDFDNSYLESLFSSEWEEYCSNDSLQGSCSGSSCGKVGYSESDYIRMGLEEVDNFSKGNNPIILSTELEQAINLGCTCVTGHTFAIDAIQCAAKEAPQLATLGKLAGSVSIGSSVIGAYLSIKDASDGNTTAQDIGMVVASSLVLIASALCFTPAAPVVVTGFTVASVVVTFFSYCLPDTSDEVSNNDY